MGRLRPINSTEGSSALGLRMKALATVAVLIPVPFLAAQTKASKPVPQSAPPAVVERGKSLFGQNCAFCHGREGGGGESGPDLMHSDLIDEDSAAGRSWHLVRRYWQRTTEAVGPSRSRDS